MCVGFQAESGPGNGGISPSFLRHPSALLQTRPALQLFPPLAPPCRSQNSNPQFSLAQSQPCSRNPLLDSSVPPALQCGEPRTKPGKFCRQRVWQQEAATGLCVYHYRLYHPPHQAIQQATPARLHTHQPRAHGNASSEANGSNGSSSAATSASALLPGHPSNQPHRSSDHATPTFDPDAFMRAHGSTVTPTDGEWIWDAPPAPAMQLASPSPRLGSAFYAAPATAAAAEPTMAASGGGALPQTPCMPADELPTPPPTAVVGEYGRRKRWVDVDGEEGERERRRRDKREKRFEEVRRELLGMTREMVRLLEMMGGEEEES